jgi:hypothetical protein
MKRLLVYGGLLAGIILVAFGIASIVLGISGRNEVNNDLKQEKIVGSADMTPQTIKAAAQKAGLQNVPLPTCTVAGQSVTSGSSAKCFGQYMRVHALIGTGGKVFSQMPQYATADGAGTNDPTQAVQQNGQPASNPARTVWVTYTALSGALNMAYFADQVGLFSIVMGIALLLTGIGLVVLDLALLARSATPTEAKATGGTAQPARPAPA